MKNWIERLLYLSAVYEVNEEYRAKFESLRQGRIYTQEQKALAVAIP